MANPMPGFRAAAWGCVFLLICAALPLAFGASVAGWLMQSIPLALLLPGLLRGDRRSLQWLGFVVLFIFVLGIMQLFTPDPRYRVLGACKVLGSLAVFGIVVYAARKSRPRPGSNSGVAP